MVRVTVGDQRLLVHHVRFDSLGITFVPATPSHARGSGEPAAPRDTAGAALAASPIPWSAIDELETRHTHVYTGIAVGTLVMLVAGEAVIGTGPEAGPANIVIGLSLPPAGAVIGGLVGAGRPRWRHEWPPAARQTRPVR